jgi:transmembrane sensor
MDKDFYIKKWLDGTLSKEEQQTFENSEDFSSLKKLSESVQAFKAPDYDVEAELDQLLSKKKGKGKVISMNWVKPLLQIAATFIVLMAGFFYFYINVNTKVQTLASEKSEHFLPDSSQVFLNALTMVSYKEYKWNNERQVNLDGEAFFKVAEGSRFDVVTNSGVVSVLGTQFNVISRNKYFEVVCFEGLVQVQSGNEIAQLPPNHFFRIIDGQIKKSDASRESSPSWLVNESSFHSVPFAHVIREFERQYGLTVRTKNVNLDLLFTGRFVHNDRSLALKAISLPLNLSYEISDEKLIILSTKGD